LGYSGEFMDGIINVYKQKGMTSHDVVARLRKIFNIKKIGHTGTLDPDAGGVLPICIGKGTKLAEYLTDKDKKYRAKLILGITTDTQDLSGQVIEKKEVNVGEEEVKSIIMSFGGDILQIPPMFSAIKINGQKLYQLARQGKTIEREKRKIRIYGIEILKIDLLHNEILFDVECSKGTYIRTLCHDIGNKIGCGGCMGSLLRIKSGEFDIASSLPLEKIKEYVDNSKINEFIKPLDYIFLKYKSAITKNQSLKWVLNGCRIYGKDIFCKEQFVFGEIIRIYDEQNNFLAIYKVEEKDGKMEFVVEKMFT